jgi:hypothetical protein
MQLSPYEAQMVRKERVKDALRKAEQERLRRVANSARPRLLDPVLARVGSLMISAGRKLQERHAPVQTGLTGSPSPASQ